ncbi:MAG: hypothetical protein NVSMB27_00670 [Ktedonobacteraceae bacterium]
MSRVRILGVVLFLVGLWIFLGPFIGPMMSLYYVPPAMSSSAMHMAAMGGLSTNAVVVNRAMLFFNFVPGALLVIVGVYLVFSGKTSRVM